MEVNSWTDYNMDWDNPDPNKPEYWWALYNAVSERYKVIGDVGKNLFYPYIQNNNWQLTYLQKLVTAVYDLFEMYVDETWNNYYITPNVSKPDPDGISGYTSFPKRLTFEYFPEELQDFMCIPICNSTAKDLKKVFKTLHDVIQKLRYTPINCMYLRKTIIQKSQAEGQADTFEETRASLLKDYEDDDSTYVYTTFDDPYELHNYADSKVIMTENSTGFFYGVDLRKLDPDRPTIRARYSAKVLEVTPYQPEGLRPRLKMVIYSQPSDITSSNLKSKYWSGNLGWGEGTTFKDLGLLENGKIYHIGPDEFEFPESFEMEMPDYGNAAYGSYNIVNIICDWFTEQRIQISMSHKYIEKISYRKII